MLEVVKAGAGKGLMMANGETGSVIVVDDWAAATFLGHLIYGA